MLPNTPIDQLQLKQGLQNVDPTAITQQKQAPTGLPIMGKMGAIKEVPKAKPTPGAFPIQEVNKYMNIKPMLTDTEIVDREQGEERAAVEGILQQAVQTKTIKSADLQRVMSRMKSKAEGESLIMDLLDDGVTIEEPKELTQSDMVAQFGPGAFGSAMVGLPKRILGGATQAIGGAINAGVESLFTQGPQELVNEAKRIIADPSRNAAEKFNQILFGEGIADYALGAIGDTFMGGMEGLYRGFLKDNEKQAISKEVKDFVTGIMSDERAVNMTEWVGEKLGGLTEQQKQEAIDLIGYGLNASDAIGFGTLAKPLKEGVEQVGRNVVKEAADTTAQMAERKAKTEFLNTAKMLAKEEGQKEGTSFVDFTLKRLTGLEGSTVKTLKNEKGLVEYGDAMGRNKDNVAQNVLDTITENNSRFGKIGETYNTVRQSGAEVPVIRLQQVADDFLSSNKIKVTNNGLDFGDAKRFTDAEKSLISNTYEKLFSIQDDVIDADTALDIRDLFTKQAAFDSNVTKGKDAVDLIKRGRGAMNSVLKEYIPGLKEADDLWIDVLDSMDDIQKKFFTTAGDQKDNIYTTVKSIMKQLDSDQEKQALKRLIPDIDDKIKYVDVLEDLLRTADTNKTGTYVSAAIASSGLVSGNLPLGVLGFLAAGYFQTPEVVKKLLMKFGKQGDEIASKIASKIKAGKELLESEKKAIQNAIELAKPKRKALPLMDEAIPEIGPDGLPNPQFTTPPQGGASVGVQEMGMGNVKQPLNSQQKALPFSVAEGVITPQGTNIPPMNAGPNLPRSNVNTLQDAMLNATDAELKSMGMTNVAIKKLRAKQALEKLNFNEASTAESATQSIAGKAEEALQEATPMSKVDDLVSTEKMKLYHGTNKQFDSFSNDKLREGAFGKGLYVTSNKDSAQRRGNAAKIAQGGDVRVIDIDIPEGTKFKVFNNETDFTKFVKDDFAGDKKKAIDFLQKNYDGLSIKEGTLKANSGTYVIFDPEKLSKTTTTTTPALGKPLPKKEIVKLYRVGENNQPGVFMSKSKEYSSAYGKDVKEYTVDLTGRKVLQTKSKADAWTQLFDDGEVNPMDFQLQRRDKIDKLKREYKYNTTIQNLIKKYNKLEMDGTIEEWIDKKIVEKAKKMGYDVVDIEDAYGTNRMGGQPETIILNKELLPNDTYLPAKGKPIQKAVPLDKIDDVSKEALKKSKEYDNLLKFLDTTDDEILLLDPDNYTKYEKSVYDSVMKDISKGEELIKKYDYYKQRVDKLGSIEQRIGKVGKNKVNTQHKNTQELERLSKKEKLITEMSEDLGMDTNEANDLFNSLQ